jgi:hypothetical protein
MPLLESEIPEKYLKKNIIPKEWENNLGATYFVCYDTCGNGFHTIDNNLAFCWNKDDLDCAIACCKDEYEVEDEDIVIFKITEIKVKTKKKTKKLTQEYFEIKYEGLE